MTKNETTRGWITFDRVEIDLDGRRLFVSGAEMPLEPKAFAVLALLARNPGQAFTRDEILDAVWGHRHVTPGVLNRVITLLRQALGESAGASQYLHTLHGVGYRFDAPVRSSAMRAEAANRSMAPDSRAAASPVAESDTSARAADEDARATEHAATLPTLSDQPAIDPPSPRRTRRVWLGALVLCALVAAAYFEYWRPAPAPASRAPTLVVLPLRPVGTAQDENVFAEGLSEELITRLARIDGLHLISQTSAALAQTDKLDLNQLAERLHVTHALEGSLRQAGQQLRIDLRLIEIPAGRTLWAQDYDRALADVFAIQSEIAQSVAATLTLKLGLQRTPVETDPQLFREYLELRRRPLDNPGVGEYAKTVELLRAFAARAPDYARAHGLLARVLLQELRVSSATPADHAEAAREAARALELDPDQVEAHTALATLACRAADWTKCMNGFRHVLTLAPTETVLRSTYGRWLAATGYLDEALRQSDIAVASDPLNYTAIFYRARVLDTLGRHDEAHRGLEAAASGAPYSAGRLPYARWFNAIWRHDYAAARACVAEMPPEEFFHEAYAATTDALVDPARWPQAKARIEESERASGRYNFVRILMPDPDFAAVLAGLEVPMLTGSSSYNMLMWNPEYAALRRAPAFQDFLQRTHIIDYWRSNGWPAQCRPDGERAVCD